MRRRKRRLSRPLAGGSYPRDALAVTALAPVAITYWAKLLEPKGVRASTTWAKLLARLSTPKEHAIKLEIPGFALATFKDDKRAIANVEKVYAVGLDLDEQCKWNALQTLFCNVASFVHTTWSSTLMEPRARVFLLLDRPVSGDEYRLVYAACAAKCETGGLIVDRAASDPSRLWFLPAIKHGGSFLTYVGDGPAVNVEAAIAAAPKQAAYTPAERPLGRTDAPAYSRARRYLHQCKGAISGSGGHAHTFVVAQKLVRGFELSAEDALDLMAREWNPRCSPPWSERELRHKVEQAAKAGRFAEGDMNAKRER